MHVSFIIFLLLSFQDECTTAAFSASHVVLNNRYAHSILLFSGNWICIFLVNQQLAVLVRRKLKTGQWARVQKSEIFPGGRVCTWYCIHCVCHSVKCRFCCRYFSIRKTYISFCQVCPWRMLTVIDVWYFDGYLRFQLAWAIVHKMLRLTIVSKASQPPDHYFAAFKLFENQ